MHRNLIAQIYNKFGKVAPKVTGSYEKTYGYPCDLYFPMHAPRRNHGYQAVSLFEPHELPDYPEEPNVKNVYFYIPNLIRKESMNSIAEQFDNFAMNLKGDTRRPFIETTPNKELPIATKVVIHIGDSEMFMYVDKKTVVNGAGNQLLMRQYLSPLTKDTSSTEEGGNN